MYNAKLTKILLAVFTVKYAEEEISHSHLDRIWQLEDLEGNFSWFGYINRYRRREELAGLGFIGFTFLS